MELKSIPKIWTTQPPQSIGGKKSNCLCSSDPSPLTCSANILPFIYPNIFSHKTKLIRSIALFIDLNRISRPTMPSLRKGHKKSFSISSRSSKGSTASKGSVPDFWTPVDKEVETKKEMEPVAEEPVAEEVREETTEKATEEAPKEEEAAPKEEAADEREGAEAEPAAEEPKANTDDEPAATEESSEEAETAAVEEAPKAVDAEAEPAAEEKKDEEVVEEEETGSSLPNCFSAAVDVNMCTLSDISTQVTSATASTTACVGAFSDMIRNPFAKEEESEEEATEEPAAEEKEEEEAAEEEEDKAEESEEKPEV